MARLQFRVVRAPPFGSTEVSFLPRIEHPFDPPPEVESSEDTIVFKNIVNVSRHGEYADPSRETASLEVRELAPKRPLVRAAPLFLRADADGDETVTLSDGVRVLRYLFGGSAVAAPCLDAYDADDSGVVDVSDGIRIFAYLFRRGPPFPPPFPAPGPDPTPDTLECDT